MRQRGVIIKALSGYYYIKSGAETTRCKLRGRFKKNAFSLCVGDEVFFHTSDEGSDGVIEQILPRRSLLKRPLAANIDQVIVTFAAKKPDLSALLLDRFLVLAQYCSLNAVLCINKCDLAEKSEVDAFLQRYLAIGYRAVETSAQEGKNIGALRELLKDKISVFAGPSGAGKSTLLNAVEATLTQKTGSVSDKLGRGRHTTRVAELFPLGFGGYVIDTPGFSFTEFNEMEKRELGGCFVEFSAAGICKFSSCLHDREIGCAVKAAVADGRIHEERYASYLHILQELHDRKKMF